MANYAFGIDVGGTTIKCGLFSVDGELLESWEINTRKEDGGKYVLPDIADSIKAKMEEKSIGYDDLKGVGIGVPGPVLEDGVVDICVNLGWGVVHVKNELSGLLNGIRVEVGNDANVAALGEYWKGGGKGYRNMVMVTLGTGVGGGVILNGKMIHGSHGAAGEIGHMQVEKNEEAACNCGKHGCLEQYASASGIVRMVRKGMADPNVKTSIVDTPDLNAKMIFDAAKEGDEFALAQVDAMGEKLGTALASIAEVVDPDAFVIGGGVSRVGLILINAVTKYYMPAAFHACRSADFKLAELGNDAGMYGAVKMVLD